MATAKKTPARTAPTKPADVVDMQLVDTSAVQQHPAPALQGSRELSDATPPANSPMAGALAFLQAGGKPEQLDQMMAIHERWQAGEARKLFADAMAAFKQNPPIILKDKAVYYETKDADGRVTGTVGYKHATLGAVVEAIVFGLAQHGITHRWETEQRDARVYVTCILTHKAGHSESTRLDGAPDSSGKKNPIQQVASTITYLQRYTLLAATGLATKDMPAPDDDGKGGGDGFIDPTDGIDPDLLQRARDASLGGWESLRRFTKNCTEDDRHQLEPVSASLKGAALLADKESITRKEAK